MLEKILGPTAEYLGEGLRSWTERRVRNVSRIFEVAAARLGDAVDEDGAVPPRVLKEILSEGSYAEDEVMAEYFGGIMACSRDEQGGDDRGASLAKLVASLSSLEIRMHYLWYSAFLLTFQDDPPDLASGRGMKTSLMFIPFRSLAPSMGIEGSPEDVGAVLEYCSTSLLRANLIGASAYGDAEFLNRTGAAKNPQRWYGESWIDVPEGGWVSGPTPAGLHLFAWAMGRKRLSRAKFFEVEAVPIDSCPVADGCRRVLDVKENPGPFG